MFLWMKWPLWVKILLSAGIAVLFLIMIPVLAAVVVIAINPLELTKRARDAVRFSDFADIQEMLVNAQKESPDASWLCSGQTPPCEGKSIDSGANPLDGAGWVKVNFTKLGMSLPVRDPQYPPKGLPVDPVNSATYYYHYCSDGKDWELDTKIESSKYADKAKSDGGDDNNLYEVGTDLTLCK